MKSEQDAVRSRIATMTPQEREVFALIVRGRTNKQVGNALGASERTIRPTASGDAFWLDAVPDRIHGISDTLNGRF